VVQVLFGYTSELSPAAAQLLMADRVGYLNKALSNSAIPVRIEALGPLSASGGALVDLYTDINALEDGHDGRFDGLTTYWAASGADALALLVPRSDQYCGMGWIPFTVDGEFAWGLHPFSVSAIDGCERSTVAHEVGHNLGVDHNPENESVNWPKAFPWAFGNYRAGVGRDVMSYTDPCGTAGCPVIAQFADPDDDFVDHPGVRSGTASRDDDRAMTDMAWAMSQYGEVTSNDHLWFQEVGGGHESSPVFGPDGDDVEAPYTPISGDFDGDGSSDQLWYFPGRPRERLWTTRRGAGRFEELQKDVQGSYRPAVGDFDGDGRDDILWHGPGSLPDQIWWGTADPAALGTQRSSMAVSGYYVPVVGDYDGDGKDDVLWYAAGSAADAVWWGEADRDHFATSRATTAITVNGTYRPVAGRFDGDDNDDIFWYAPGTAPDAIWPGRTRSSFGSGSATAVTVNGTYDPLAGDFDGDGIDDVLWYAEGTAADTFWWGQPTLAGIGPARSTATTINGYYEPTAGNFDGTGPDDVFWFAFG
jgi:hypothetical protein